MKNQKGIDVLEMNFPLRTTLKALKYKSILSFSACQKKIVEFTDSTHTID